MKWFQSKVNIKNFFDYLKSFFLFNLFNKGLNVVSKQIDILKSSVLKSVINSEDVMLVAIFHS